MGSHHVAQWYRVQKAIQRRSDTRSRIYASLQGGGDILGYIIAVDGSVMGDVKTTKGQYLEQDFHNGVNMVF